MTVISFDSLMQRYYEKATDCVSIKDITAFFNLAARDLLGDVPAHQRQRFVIECYEGMFGSFDNFSLTSSMLTGWEVIGGVLDAYNAHMERSAALQSVAA